MDLSIISFPSPFYIVAAIKWVSYNIAAYLPVRVVTDLL